MAQTPQVFKYGIFKIVENIEIIVINTGRGIELRDMANVEKFQAAANDLV